MSAALSYFASHATISPDRFWCSVDERLESEGHAPALWTEELANVYAAGLSIGEAVRVVVARRKVRS